MVAYSIPPVESVTVYRQDVVVNRKETTAPQKEPPKRGDIQQWSDASRKRLAFIASNTPVTFRTMITLTYPSEYTRDGRRVQADLKAFLQALRRWTAGRLTYLWFKEFQQRGAPHFHILIDVPMPRTRDGKKSFRNWVGQTWFRIVDSGDVKHRRAGTRTEAVRKPDGAKRYAVKYAFKMRQKVVPPDFQNVGRLWACSKDVVPRPQMTLRCTEDDIRGLLDDWRYLPSDDRPIYRVLYNVADKFREKDNPPTTARPMQTHQRDATRRVAVYPVSRPSASKACHVHDSGTVDAGSMS